LPLCLSLIVVELSSVTSQSSFKLLKGLKAKLSLSFALSPINPVAQLPTTSVFPLVASTKPVAGDVSGVAVKVKL